MLKISAPATFSYLESSFHTAQASARGLDFDADQKIAASWDENERTRYAHPYCARIPVVMTSRHILSPPRLKSFVVKLSALVRCDHFVQIQLS